MKIKKIIKDSLGLLIVVFLVSIVYGIKIVPMILCIVTGIFVNINILKEKRIEKKRLERFNDVVLYMEQMIYSFKKQPKIRLALEDARKVSSTEMKEVLEEAIVNIDSRVSENIYEESLDIIKEEYECKKIKSLHEFLIKIETHGGEYENYLDIILDDIKAWYDRITVFINNVSRVKRNIMISICSTLITCGFMRFLIPKGYGYTNHLVYQICTTLLIILMLVVYYLSFKKLNFNWIEEKEAMTEQQILRYYALVEKRFVNKNNLSFMEKSSYKKAKKRLENEIIKEFPDWLRQVAINLQNETVQSSIESSYEEAPFVLKRPIRKLLIDFEKYPIGIEPYDNFLKELDLQDTRSSMKMFYSINELGKGEMQTQINSIIDRNNKLERHSESLKNRDKIGIAGMLSAVPMLFGVGKIIIDMVLMIMVFTTSISSAINGG